MNAYCLSPYFAQPWKNKGTKAERRCQVVSPVRGSIYPTTPGRCLSALFLRKRILKRETHHHFEQLAVLGDQLFLTSKCLSHKLVLALSLGDMENQSPPSFLHPALSKEKCQSSLYGTTQNPPGFLNPLLPWHTSLRTFLYLFASNLPKLYQVWLSCWQQSLPDCFSSSFKCYTCHQTLMYA